VKRMLETAHFMLNREDGFITVQIHDILKAPLVRVHISRNQIAFEEPAIRTGEVRDVNLHMVSVIGRHDSSGFPGDQALMSSCAYPRHNRSVPHRDIRRGIDNLSIETRNASGSSGGRCKLDVRDAELRFSQLR